MNKPREVLRKGDLVRVKSPSEILRTLDSDGAVDHLPFMPEMLAYCGGTFRVAERVVETCISGPGWRREFKSQDVVTLEELRCSGAAHDGCQKACLIFWRDSWLSKVEEEARPEIPDPADLDWLAERLKVSRGSGAYFCQSSELPAATTPLSTRARAMKYFAALRARNYGLGYLIRSLGIWVVFRTRLLLFGIQPRGTAHPTPVESLDLQPGEWVQVKSLKSIIETLDERGLNRGLSFSAYMHLLAGKKLKVKQRVDRIILDGTGQMRQLGNTVWLEGSTCGCAYMGLGMAACSRCEIAYWREVWLQRASPD
jgi:hypothetical protein